MHNFFRINRLSLSVILLLIIAIFSIPIGLVWGVGVSSLWNQSELFFSVVIPFAITFTILGAYFSKKKELTNTLLWKISLVCAFSLTFYFFTIGNYIAQLLIGDSERKIYIENMLVWGAVFTLILLPITTPLARFLVGIFHKIIRK